MHSLHASANSFDIRIRRLAVVIYAVGIAFTCLLANLPLHLPDVHRRALNLITLPALASLIAIWFFPWHRFHRLLFLTITSSAITLISLAIAASGGWQSPLVDFYFLVVVFSAAYYPRPVALLADGCVALCSLTPALYQPATAALLVHCALFAAVCLCTGYVAGVMMRETRRWERKAAAAVARREQGERELARLTALYRAGVAVSAELDAQRVMETVVHELALSLGYRFVGIYLREGEAHCLRAQVGFAVPIERIGFDEGVIGRVYRTGRGVLVEDVHADPDYLVTDPTMRSEVCAPILRDRLVIGVVNVESEDRLDRGDLEVLELFAQQIGAALANADAHAAMAATARSDALTSTLNRGALLDALGSDVDVAGRVSGSLAILFVDVDNFKGHNDRYGHAFGDEVLRGCARIIRAHLAPGEALGRYGGDEFVAILPGADHERGLLVAEAIRASISQCSLGAAGDEAHAAVTVSVGVACLPGQGTALWELLRAADGALYAAKAAGRDRVCIAGAGRGGEHIRRG